MDKKKKEDVTIQGDTEVELTFHCHKCNAEHKFIQCGNCGERFTVKLNFKMPKFPTRNKRVYE